MMKRILALSLCIIMALAALASCSGTTLQGGEDRGAEITMYLADEVYDFDPASAYNNDSALKIASLLYDNLFVLDKNGNVQKSLVKDYEIYENESTDEYKMRIWLNNTQWSDTATLSSADVQYAWKRIIAVDSTSPAASLLFDIKNARAVKAGDVSIDKFGVYAMSTDLLEIEFEGKIDYDQFILNLTSYALVPLRELYVERTADWAKKPSTIICSGPFKLSEISYEDDDKGLVLTRNTFYKALDQIEQPLDKYVTPYKLIVDYTMSDEEIAAGYQNGSIYYVGEIPYSIRNSELASKAVVSDALSTHTYYLNTNKEPFNNKNVRKALSMAINRDAIAEAVVFAKAATGFVPNGSLDPTSGFFKKYYRDIAGTIITNTKDDINAAKSLLSDAGINPSKYSFDITVAAYDEVHVAIAEMVAAAWGKDGLGFNVKVNKLAVKVNDDKQPTDDPATNEVASDYKDDVFLEAFKEGGDFDVFAFDYVAFSASPYSVLSQFAYSFTGNETDMGVKDENGNYIYIPDAHMTGFNNEEYNNIFEALFLLQYYKGVEADGYEDFVQMMADEFEQYQGDEEKAKAVLDSAIATYEKYGIDSVKVGEKFFFGLFSNNDKYREAMSKLLVEAEKLILDEMPIIPIVFNENAYLINDKELSKYEFDYYGMPEFAKLYLKDYWNKRPAAEE